MLYRRVLDLWNHQKNLYLHMILNTQIIALNHSPRSSSMRIYQGPPITSIPISTNIEPSTTLSSVHPTLIPSSALSKACSNPLEPFNSCEPWLQISLKAFAALSNPNHSILILHQHAHVVLVTKEANPKAKNKKSTPSQPTVCPSPTPSCKTLLF